MRKLPAAAALVAIVAMLATQPASAGTSTETYTAGVAGDFVNECAEDNPAGENIAAACKGTPGTGSAMTVRVDDDNFGPVDFFYIWQNAAGDCVGESSYHTESCPNSGFGYGSIRLVAPSGAARLKVMVSGPFFATLNSVFDGTEGGFGVTTGKISFTS